MSASAARASVRRGHELTLFAPPRGPCRRHRVLVSIAKHMPWANARDNRRRPHPATALHSTLSSRDPGASSTKPDRALGVRSDAAPLSDPPRAARPRPRETRGDQKKRDGRKPSSPGLRVLTATSRIIAAVRAERPLRASCRYCWRRAWLMAGANIASRHALLGPVTSVVAKLSHSRFLISSPASGSSTATAANAINRAPRRRIADPHGGRGRRMQPVNA
jgi:hypothetical protein